MTSKPDALDEAPEGVEPDAVAAVAPDAGAEPGEAEASEAELDETDAGEPGEADAGEADVAEEPSEPDARLLEAHDLALAALREITPAVTIGEPAGYTLERGGVVSLRFENRLAGYPGWFWTVSVARVEDAEPTVLEVELLPGEGALLAPDWVPWAVRLAEYQAAQAALALAERADAAEDEPGDLDDLDDVEDLDAADFDDDGSPILHAGDLDGVDIDELAESGALDGGSDGPGDDLEPDDEDADVDFEPDDEDDDLESDDDDIEGDEDADDFDEVDFDDEADAALDDDPTFDDHR